MPISKQPPPGYIFEKSNPYLWTCLLCGKILDAKARGQVSHGRMHVRKGEAKEIVETEMVEIKKTWHVKAWE